MRGPAKHLTKGVAIYGAGDAITTVVNFFLLGVYVKFDILTTVDYGALALIISAETFAKVLSRWGLDGAFMRFYYEREDGAPRRRMASTIVWFMIAVNAALMTAALLGSRAIASALSLAPGYLPALRFMFLHIGLVAFTFVPMHAMRMRNQAAVYSAFTFARSAGTVVLRIVLVIGLRMGITGMYLTDVILTVVLLACMWPWFRTLVGWTFSFDELRQSLRFGLPRLPAGLASQALDSTPKILLGQHFPQSEVGVYQNGTTLGTAVAFFKSAFETAWAPFYYETSKKPDARIVFSKMTTYGDRRHRPARCRHDRRGPGRHPARARAGVPGCRAGRADDRPRHGPAGRLPAHLDRPEPHEPDRVLLALDDYRGARRARGRTPADSPLRRGRRGGRPCCWPMRRRP